MVKEDYSFSKSSKDNTKEKQNSVNTNHEGIENSSLVKFVVGLINFLNFPKHDISFGERIFGSKEKKESLKKLTFQKKVLNLLALAFVTLFSFVSFLFILLSFFSYFFFREPINLFVFIPQLVIFGSSLILCFISILFKTQKFWILYFWSPISIVCCDITGFTYNHNFFFLNLVIFLILYSVNFQSRNIFAFSKTPRLYIFKILDSFNTFFIFILFLFGFILPSTIGFILEFIFVSSSPVTVTPANQYIEILYSYIIVSSIAVISFLYFFYSGIIQKKKEMVLNVVDQKILFLDVFSDKRVKYLLQKDPFFAVLDFPIMVKRMYKYLGNLRTFYPSSSNTKLPIQSISINEGEPQLMRSGKNGEGEGETENEQPSSMYDNRSIASTESYFSTSNFDEDSFRIGAIKKHFIICCIRIENLFIEENNIFLNARYRNVFDIIHNFAEEKRGELKEFSEKKFYVCFNNYKSAIDFSFEICKKLDQLNSDVLSNTLNFLRFSIGITKGSVMDGLLGNEARRKELFFGESKRMASALSLYGLRLEKKLVISDIIYNVIENDYVINFLDYVFSDSRRNRKELRMIFELTPARKCNDYEHVFMIKKQQLESPQKRSANQVIQLMRESKFEECIAVLRKMEKTDTQFFKYLSQAIHNTQRDQDTESNFTFDFISQRRKSIPQLYPSPFHTIP